MTHIIQKGTYFQGIKDNDLVSSLADIVSKDVLEGVNGNSDSTPQAFCINICTSLFFTNLDDALYEMFTINLCTVTNI